MQDSLYRKIRVVFWVLGLGLAAAQAWISRFDIVNDTISYLDMGDYFFHGYPAAIINGIWSPLYAFLLGATLAIFKPTIHGEYPAVHALLFGIFVFAFASFDFFLAQLARLGPRSGANGSAPQIGWPWLVIAYVIFLWASLALIGVYETNPDMLVAGFFFLSCALLIKIAVEPVTWRSYLALGLVLGFSYLTKAVMFPLALVLLATAWLASQRKGQNVLVTAGAFLLVALPFVVALSAQKGHITWGESGAYNYAVHVNGIARHHWQGDPHVAGFPIHPTREIFAAPATFEFKEPVRGTYPAWYDPTFWYDGVKPHFRLADQFRVSARNFYFEFETIFYALNGVLFVTLFLAFYEAKNKLAVLENLFRLWFLLVPAVIGIALYGLVHYESRYIGPFLVVFGVCLFSCIVWADDYPRRRLFAGIAVVQALVFLWIVALPIVRTLRHPGTPEKGSYQAVAEGAEKLGLRPGDQVASLNFSNLGTAMWARLARVKIIAEVYYWPNGHEGAENCFWNADAGTQEQVLQRLSQTGAKAVVSSDAPSGPSAGHWSRIGETGYYLLWLNPATVASDGSLHQAESK